MRFRNIRRKLRRSPGGELKSNNRDSIIVKYWSLIVGLGAYSGGELMVEGVKNDIRYKPLQFNGWTERHWTKPFLGERYSLVWFTPKGCEGVHGIDLCQ